MAGFMDCVLTPDPREIIARSGPLSVQQHGPFVSHLRRPVVERADEFSYLREGDPFVGGREGAYTNDDFNKTGDRKNDTRVSHFMNTLGILGVGQGLGLDKHRLFLSQSKDNENKEPGFGPFRIHVTTGKAGGGKHRLRDRDRGEKGDGIQKVPLYARIDMQEDSVAAVSLAGIGSYEALFSKQHAFPDLDEGDSPSKEILKKWLLGPAAISIVYNFFLACFTVNGVPVPVVPGSPRFGKACKKMRQFVDDAYREAFSKPDELIQRAKTLGMNPRVVSPSLFAGASDAVVDTGLYDALKKSPDKAGPLRMIDLALYLPPALDQIR